MPKLMCLCGFVHDLSPIPDDGWVTIRDREYEDFIAAALAARIDAALRAAAPGSLVRVRRPSAP